MNPEQKSSPAATGETQVLDTLLQRPAATPERVDSILVGYIDGIAPDGAPYVTIETFGFTAVPAASLTPISTEHIGKRVALGFEGGNPRRPVILGLMFEPAQWTASSTPEAAPLDVVQEGGRSIITAEDELELRCGEARILMRADGRIYLRGSYITSHAEVGQRIRGGTVQLN